MKPNFALTLSFDGIGVLHRAFPGWHLVGDVALDSDDLAGELGRLREMAQALDPSGLRTKLVIPNDQIRYLNFDMDGLGPEEVADAVARELDGATPYAVDDLAYDWSISAGQVYVAAVARETLAEAEAFAVEHRFNPLAFVARPEGRDFVGEPWLGETAHAASVLPEGGHVERDTAAIRIIGAAQLPADTQPRDSDLSADPVVEVADPPEPIAESPDYEDIARPAPTVQEPDETAPDPERMVAFTSIRANRRETRADTPRLSGATRDPAPRPQTGMSGSEPAISAATPAPADAAPHVTGAPDDSLTDSVAARIGASLRPTEADRLSNPDEPAPHSAAPRAGAPAGEPLAATGPETDSPSFFTRRSADLKRALSRAPAPIPSGSTQPLAPQDEEQRMTIFGARQPVKVGGKPRFLGIILTAVLLLFLVGVAAWASIFLDDGLARFLGNAPETEIAETPAPDVETLEDLAAALPEPEPADPDPQEDTRLAALPGDSVIDTEDPARDLRPEAQPSRLDPDQARSRYAVTGIWLRAPDTPRAPEVMSLDDFYMTSIDPKVIEQDAVALPGADTLLGDRRPESPGVPPAPGTTFDFDERGLVRATPDGAVTPDGVTIFAGQPPVAMPERPVTTVTEPEQQALPDPDLARLAALRPLPRPGDLSEQNERGQIGLGGRTRSELASLRPRLRPASAQELAQQAASASTAAVADPEAEDDIVEAAVDPFAQATEQAVALSIKPKTRPNNFARIVDEAEEAAAATPVPASQRVAPSAPTATTVARAATERNALTLRRLNLIGVYGTNSDPRALVRLANGRYQKVKVGDRLDGGRVAAIGPGELRYVKSGRSVVLKMPRG